MRLATLLRELQLAFPDKPIPAETLQLYARKLADVPLDVLAPVVHEVVCTARFFPRLAEIRSACAERALALPGDVQAVAQVDARLAWARGGLNGDAPDVHPLVREALDAVGGMYAYRMTDRPDVIRAQFLSAYRDIRSDAIRDVAIHGFRKAIEP